MFTNRLISRILSSLLILVFMMAQVVPSVSRQFG
jgi:hypothetical protein